MTVDEVANARNEIPMKSVTDEITDFITSVKFEDIPTLGMARAVDAITDCAGVALAGSQEPIAAILHAVCAKNGAFGEGATVIGSHSKASWADAAFINGALSHAIDYDDISHPAYSHPTSHLLPPLLSLGQCTRRNGEALLAAYVVGLEIESKLGRSLNFGHYSKGWHATGTFGPIAAAAACAHLLGLNKPKTRTALAIAASSSAGLRANFGTMTKPLHAGNAARSGVLAAMLAEEDFTATDDVFEARYGYLDVFAGDQAASEEPFRMLGAPWEITTDIGLALKPYPACGATHPAIEAALLIREVVPAENVASVTVGVSSMAPQILVYANPTSPLQGKFSMQFCIAAALATGNVSRSTFSPEVLESPLVRSLLPKVSMRVDDRVRDNSEFGAVVTVVDSAGSSEERLVELAKGKPERWLDKDDLHRKFQDCSEPVLGAERTSAAFNALQDIATCADLSELADALVPS